MDYRKMTKAELTAEALKLRRRVEKLGKDLKKATEEKFRAEAILDALGDGIIVQDTKYRIIYQNRIQNELYGDRSGELCYKTYEGLDDVCPGCPVEMTFKDGEIYRSERAVETDKGTLYTSLTSSPLRNPDGKITAGIKIVRDITGQKRLEEELRRHQERLEEIVEERTARLQQEFAERLLAKKNLYAEQERLAVTLKSIGDGVLTTDIEGRVTLINKVAERLTGWTQEEAFGRPLSEVFHIINEHTRERCENPAEKVIRTGHVVGLANNTVLISKDGIERVIADSGAPIKDGEGNTVGVVLVFRDATEKRKLQQELLKSQKLDSLGVLAGGIAHDFNNVLMAITTNIAIAKMLARSDEKVSEKLTAVEKSAFRASLLTQQLLTFSQGGSPVKKTISVGDLIRESADFALTGSSSECEYSIPEDLWSVEADEGQISQVVSNIIINSDQSMPDGGLIWVGAGNIKLKSGGAVPLKAGNYVLISIKDHGHGIKTEHLGKIFDPYFTTKQKGRGLGLSSAYSIAVKHEGHISVESTLGVGSTFHLYLPASGGRARGNDLLPEGRPVGVGKVLLMDDDEEIAASVGEAIEFLGYTVETARDGEEAIKKYTEAKDSGMPFSVVILDVTVPGGMGGKKAIKELLRIDPGVKAIVSSGYSTDPIMSHFRDYGFSGVISKPYRLEDVSVLLRKLHE